MSYNKPVAPIKVMSFWKFSFPCLISSSCSWGHSSYPRGKVSFIHLSCTQPNWIGLCPPSCYTCPVQSNQCEGLAEKCPALRWLIYFCTWGRQTGNPALEKTRRNDERKAALLFIYQPAAIHHEPVPDQKWTLRGAEILSLLRKKILKRSKCLLFPSKRRFLWIM